MSLTVSQPLPLIVAMTKERLLTLGTYKMLRAQTETAQGKIQQEMGIRLVTVEQEPAQEMDVPIFS